MRLPRLALPFLAVWTTLPAKETLEPKHGAALVIANSKYEAGELPEAHDHAREMASALGKAGFHVTVVENVDHKASKEALLRFNHTVPTKGIALVYFAGYLRQYQDTQILSPAGKRRFLDNESSVKKILLNLDTRSGASCQILLLDGQARLPGTPKSDEIHELAKEIQPNSLVICSKVPGQLAKQAKVAFQGQKPLVEALATLGDNQVSSLATADTLKTVLARTNSPPGKLQEGQKPGETWVNPLGMVFCWVPPGTVKIGSPEKEKGRDPDESQAETHLDQGFWMAKYELTRRQFSTLTERLHVGGNYLSTGKDKHHPLNKMRIQDPASYVEKLNATAPAGWEYALPTEAEWEYAARAGTSTAYWFGDDPALLPQFGNFADKSLRSSLETGEVNRVWANKETHFDTQTGLFGYAHKTWEDGFPLMATIGNFPPNPWGLHDIHGNLAELTSTVYQAERKVIEQPANNTIWVCKGGSWASTAAYCRSAFRGQFTFRSRENQTENYLGLRFILKPAQ